MKRPLALAGFLYLVTQLLAAFLPPAAFGPLAAVFALAAGIAYKAARSFRPHAVLACAVCAAAFVLRVVSLAWNVTPVQARAGQEGNVCASVAQVQDGFVEDTVRAVLLVESMDGEAVRPFRVYCAIFPDVSMGERVTARVIFEPLESDRYTYANYADGVFLACEYQDGFASLGESNALWAFCGRMQDTLRDGLRRVLAQPYAGVAAAMTVGDDAALDDDVHDAFRVAGLSHVLVVSGLHLSAVSGLVFAAMRRLAGYRAAAACAVVSTLGFMCLTGCTPSVVRAGTAMLLLYGGMLFGRRSDALTSLGLAALLLCLQNPYAAVDVGLLLSFSATLGVLWVVAARRRRMLDQKVRAPEKDMPLSRRVLQRIFWTAAVPCATTLATLPVLIAVGSGISLLSVAANLLVVPVIPIAMTAGFVTALCACVPPLAFAANLAGLVCSVTLRWMLAVARLVSEVPYAFVHISGAFAMCVALLLCGLFWSAWYLRVKWQKALSACVLFAAVCAGLYGAADAGVVRMELAGDAANPPLVILKGTKTAVLFRGPESNVDDVWEVLEHYNRTGVDLLVDLRADGDAGVLAQQLAARQTVSAQSDLVNNTILKPFHDIIIYVRHQAEGNFACVEVRGYRVGIASGSVELSSWPPFDIFVAGTGRPDGLSCTNLIVPRTGYRWIEDAPDARRYGPADIILRAGASVKIKEETNDLT